MPRSKNMITRTIIGTEVTLLALDTKTEKVQNVTYTLSGKYKDNDVLLRAVQRQCDTETLKHVSVVSAHAVNQLYGMDECEFILSAVKLDDNRKPIVEA